MKNSHNYFPWALCAAALLACFYAIDADAASTDAPALQAGLKALGIEEGYQIVVADERDIVEDTAAQMTRRFLAKAAIDASIVTESEAAGEKQFLLGRESNLRAIRALGDKGDINIRDVSPEDDGFHLKQIGKHVVIAGANTRGVLYGVYAFEDFIGAGEKGQLDIKKVPYYRKRGTGLYLTKVGFGAPLDAIPEEMAIYLSRLGINQMTDQGIGGYLSKFVKSEVFPFQTPPDPVFQQRMKDMSALLRRYGIDAYIFLNEPTIEPINGSYDLYPKEALGKVKRSWGGDENGLSTTLCVSSPLGQEYLRSMMRKFVQEYPDVKGVNFYNLDGGAWLCTPELCERCKQVCTDSPPDSSTPWETQAKLVSLLAEAAHEERPEFKFQFWGAVHYSGQPFEKMLHATEGFDGLLSSWTGSDRTLMVPDAAQRSIEFTLSQEICKEKEVPFYLLAEFNSLEAIPKNLPFPYHAADALRKYKAWDVKNVMEIFGIAAELNPINALITKEFEWEPDQPIENVLDSLSRRQFGEPAGKEMRGAWEEMKKAFDVWNDVQSSAFPLAGSQFFAKIGPEIGGLPPAILPEKILPYNLDGLNPEFLDKMELMNSHLAQAAEYAQKAVDAASSEERIGICYYEGPDGPPTCKAYAELNHSSIAFANAICMQRCNLIRAYPLMKEIEKARAAGDEQSASKQQMKYRELVQKDIETQERFCDLLTSFSKMQPCYMRTSLTEGDIASHLAFTRDKIKELKAYLATTSTTSYDFSERMSGIKGLPLETPEKPFALRFTEEELMNQPIWSTQVDGIVTQAKADSPIQIGAKALQSTLQSIVGHTVPIITVEPEQAALPEGLPGKYYIVLGAPKDFKLAASLANAAGIEVTDEALNGDGFWVKPLESGERHLLLVASPVSRGAMYGAYELEERSTGRGVPRLDQAFAPRMRYRGWPIHNHEVPTPLGVSGRWRYNMSPEYCAFWPRLLFLPDYPELGGEAHRAKIEKQRQALHERFADMMRYGSAPTLFYNFFTLQWAPIGLESARKVLSEEYPGILAQPESKYPLSLCPSHPEFRRLVTRMLRELVEAFPELEVVILQTSDEGGELLCNCERCKQSSYLDREIDYTKLIINTAREVNPKLRFFFFGSGTVNKMAEEDRSLANEPTMGMSLLKERLGNDIEGFWLMATTPPGFDVQTWLSPDSTALGQGLSLLYLFHWYEAGGPGIVAPISPAMSHISWPLPLYLDKLKRYGAPDSGMVGAVSPVAGMDVAWWHPDLDPSTFMRNWCRAKYGREAGDYVYEALPGTHRLTEAFHLDTKSNANESFDLYRWGAVGQPWAVSMDDLERTGLRKDQTGQTTLASIAQQGFMFPQAPRPEAFKTLTSDGMKPWLERFTLSEEKAIGDRCEEMMGKALALKPENVELQRLNNMAKSTKALIHLFSDYQLAMVYASAAHNSPDGEVRTRLVDEARSHLNAAADNAVIYKTCMLSVTEKEKLIRMTRDTEMFYVAGTVCLVREGAYLFDQEFGGESTLDHFDTAIGL